MDNEVQPPGPKAIAQCQQVHQWIDGTFLGAADNGHNSVHWLAALQAAFQSEPSAKEMANVSSAGGGFHRHRSRAFGIGEGGSECEKADWPKDAIATFHLPMAPTSTVISPRKRSLSIRLL